MDVEYAYCSRCGSEYDKGVFLAYIRSTASGKLLQCEDCGGEISLFVSLAEAELDYE